MSSSWLSFPFSRPSMAFALLDLSHSWLYSLFCSRAAQFLATKPRCRKCTIHLRGFNPSPIAGLWRNIRDDGRNPLMIHINFGVKLPKNSIGKKNQPKKILSTIILTWMMGLLRYVHTYKYLHTSIANLASVVCTFKKKSNIQKFNPILT